MNKRIQGHLIFIALWTGVVLLCLMGSNNSDIKAGKIIGLLAFPFVVCAIDYLYYTNNKEKCEKRNQELEDREKIIKQVQGLAKDMDEIKEAEEDLKLFDEIQERVKRGENIRKNKELRQRIQNRSSRCPELNRFNAELKWMDEHIKE